MARSLRGEAAASASAAAAVVQLDEGEGGVTTEDVAARGSAPAASAGAIGGLVRLGSTVSSKVGSGFGPSLGCFAGGGCVHSRNATQCGKHLSNDRYRSAAAGSLQKSQSGLARMASERDILGCMRANRFRAAVGHAGPPFVARAASRTHQ